MRVTTPVAECYGCDEYIWEATEAHPLVDGHGILYGYHCERCAEGAFDSYMEGRIG
jgi:hypothetical protein